MVADSLIKEKLERSNKSMRQLAKETGINVSTISRIISGKRKATITHLQALSKSLHIPLSALLEEEENQNKDTAPFQYLSELIKAMNLPVQGFTRDKVVSYLKKCEKESDTKAGKRRIHTHFKSKLVMLQADGPFVEQLEYLYQKYQDRLLNRKEMLLIGGALFYFITSTDLIPDYLFPVGYLDDALVVQYILQSLSNKM